MASGEGLLGLEEALAVAQKHRYRIGEPIGDRQVGHAVSVEVADRHRGGIGSGIEVLLWLESAVSVAQEH